MLSCSGCDRDSSKGVVDSSQFPQNFQVSSGIETAVTAEQWKQERKKVATELWAECLNTPLFGVAPTNAGESCPEAIRNEGGCLKYAEDFLAKKHPGLFCRKGENLVLKLSNGEFELFQNKTDENDLDNFVSYYFDKYLPEIHYGLIYDGFYEGGTYELVNLATGTRKDVGGDVVLSPDKKRVAAFFSDLEAGFSPNVLSVYLVTPHGLVEEFKGQPENWGVDDLKWIDEKTIEFNKVSFEGSVFHNEKHHLQFFGEDISKQGHWQIDRGLQVEKERMQIKLNDIEALVSHNAAIVSVIATSTGAQVTGYGLSDVDAFVLAASLTSRYLSNRIKASNPTHETYCGRIFSKIIIEIEGDSSTLESKQHIGFAPVLIKSKDGNTIECPLP